MFLGRVNLIINIVVLLLSRAEKTQCFICRSGQSTQKVVWQVWGVLHGDFRPAVCVYVCIMQWSGEILHYVSNHGSNHCLLKVSSFQGFVHPSTVYMAGAIAGALQAGVRAPTTKVSLFGWRDTILETRCVSLV